MLLKMSYLKIWSHKKMYNWPPLWAAVVLMSADDWCAWHVSKCLVFRLPGKRDGDLCRNSKTTVAPRSFTLSTKSFSDSEYIFELQDSTKIQASQRCLSISSISVFIPTWCKHETHDRIRSSLKGSMLSGGGKSGSRDIWPVLGVSPYNPQEIGRLNFPNWGCWWRF